LSTPEPDQANLDRVKAYLEQEFPEHKWMSRVSGGGDSYFSAQGSRSKGTAPHFVRLTEEFFEAHRRDVLTPLREWGLASRLRTVASARRVIVTSRGLDEESK
jgi:hypothetical protein